MDTLSILKQENQTDGSHSLANLATAILAMPYDLIRPLDGKPVTTSQLLAQATQADHTAMLSLIVKYRDNLAYHGNLLETDGKVILSEEQASLLLSFMRNTDISRVCRILLKRAFYEAREALPNARNPFKYPNNLFQQQMIEELQRQQNIGVFNAPVFIVPQYNEVVA